VAFMDADRHPRFEWHPKRFGGSWLPVQLQPMWPGNWPAYSENAFVPTSGAFRLQKL
jgi:hypothetical protein